MSFCLRGYLICVFYIILDVCGLFMVCLSVGLRLMYVRLFCVLFVCGWVVGCVLAF